MDIEKVLIEAGTKYKKEMLVAPMVAFDELKPHFNIITGVRGKVTGGILSVKARFRPYKSEKNAKKNISIKAHSWEAYLADVVEEFDPHKILGTLYTEPTATKPDAMAIGKKIALQVALSAGEGLYNELFTAVRDDDGDDTEDLFNGYTTILKKAVTDGKASETIGNYMDLSAVAIDDSNAGDILTGIWRESNKHLKKNCKMYLSPTVIEHYENWFQNKFHSTPWNKEFQQRRLHSSRGKCEFVELDNMEGQDFLYLSASQNMNIGFDQTSDIEKVEIRRCDNPKMLQLFMVTHFGVGFETIMPEFLCGAKLKFN